MSEDLMSSRTSKARSTAHEASCGCPQCFYRARRAARAGGAQGFPAIVDWRAAQERRQASAAPLGRVEERLDQDLMPGKGGKPTTSAQAPSGATSPSGRVSAASSSSTRTRNAIPVDQDQQDQDAEVEVPAWPNVLAMIADEFPDLQGESWWPWRTYLKIVNALPLDARELTFAQAHTGRTVMPTTPVRRIYCGAGRRGGKSLIDAVQAVFHAVKARTWTLAPGEWSTIPIIAADRTQATVIYGYVRGLLQSSATLSPLIVGKPTKDRITLSNRTVIRIFTASFKTSRGYSLAAAVGDEVAFWESSETSTNPDKEIVNALKPGLLSTRGPLIITSTPYSRRGVLYEGFKSYFGQDGADGLYWKASSLDMNPLLDPAEIQAAFEEDPEAAAAEYGGEFRSDLVSFISEELIAAVVVPGRGDLPYNPKHKYAAFADPSGGSIGGDSYALAIGHTEGDVHVVDCIREAVPPFSPEGVTASHAEVCQMYHVREVTGDRYAAEWPVQAWRDHGGITYRQSEDPKSDLYLAALPVLTSGKAELPESKRLIAQLRGLERRTARSGKDSIDHAPRGRDDLSNVVAGLIALLQRKRRHWGHLPPTAQTKDWTKPTAGRVVDAAGTRYLGDGRFRTASGEDWRDPRY